MKWQQVSGNSQSKSLSLFPEERIMPKHTEEVDYEHALKLMEGGGLKDKSLKLRKKIAQDFDSYAQANFSLTCAEIVSGDVKQLEKALIGFFETLRVSQRQEDGSMVDVIPKRNTIDSYKSNLKQHILDLTESQLDITSARFPLFSKFMKGYCREVKTVGRGETKHHQPIDDESLKKIYCLGADVGAVFEAKIRDKSVIHELVSKLPEKYRGSYHYLLQMLVQFTLTLFDVRRGNEGLDMLTKNHFEKSHYPKGGYDFWRKVMGEESKNHKQDSENLDSSGIIPCVENEFGFNPGKMLGLYMQFLNPDNPYLFQRPRRPSKEFNIDEEDKCLFEPSKVGKNLVAEMMKKMCSVLGLPTFTNHCIRATGIVMLKKSGFGDREIMRLSGHKAASSLEHYDPSTSIEKKSDMANCLLMKKRPAETPTEEKENVPVPFKRPSLDYTAVSTTVSVPSASSTPVSVPSASCTPDPVLLLLHREQELRRSDQEQRKADQEQRKEEFSLIKAMTNHIMEMNKAMSKK